jgi:hypothetical protein
MIAMSGHCLGSVSIPFDEMGRWHNMELNRVQSSFYEEEGTGEDDSVERINIVSLDKNDAMVEAHPGRKQQLKHLPGRGPFSGIKSGLCENPANKMDDRHSGKGNLLDILYYALQFDHFITASTDRNETQSKRLVEKFWVFTRNMDNQSVHNWNRTGHSSRQ